MAIAPVKATKIWNNIPAKISTILIMAPIILEKTFDMNVLNTSPKSKPLGYPHLYLLQGEKNVFKRSENEKRFLAKTK
jgi:hypothetical protein